MQKPHDSILAYIDGGFQHHTGIGGWAAVIYFPDHRYLETCGAQRAAGSLHMETLAAIRALDTLLPGCQVALYTDCLHLKQVAEGIQATGHLPRRNQDVWQELGRLLRRHRVYWHYVAGHRGNRDNERCHQLCQWAMQEHRFEVMREKRIAT